MTRAEKINEIKNAKPIRVADAVFFAVLAVLIGLLFYFMILRPAAYDGELRVVVRMEGRQIGSHRLSEDGVFDVGGQLTLVIENGTAYIKNPTCPDRVCVSMGRIRRAHEMIVCAPRGITVRITGDSEIAAGAR